MAYAEKRGKSSRPWRVKYKLPGGADVSESGFETKSAALAWGRDQEARIREGRWTDPSAGKITVGEWIDRWLAIQDVGISTEDSREYLIRRFLRPAWGGTELSALSTEAITRWENALPARTGISPRTARAARTLLGTILGDAAAARPPLIPYNPALRPRNRGRRTGRRLERTPSRTWATPLQVLLLAERGALLSGRDEDFTMIVTIAYTGMRWGEAIGLEREHARPGEIYVEWQLRELRGQFHRLPPKDDSYRSPSWEPGLPVDLPSFLDELVTRQITNHPHPACTCGGQHDGSGRYVFLGPDGGHYRRSNYARRVFRPACDGRHEATPSRPGRLIIADATTWPGVPVAAWPPDAATNATYTPPRGRGIAAIPADTPLACWLPIRPGLTPHGLRHSHKTWMAEDGIPEILAEQRLGHQVPGIRGLYAHSSDRMRDDLKAALQVRWEESLRARAALSPHSSLPLLDELLAPPETPCQSAPAAGTAKMISQIPPKFPGGTASPTRVEPALRASDLARHQDSASGAKGTRTPDPLLAKQVLFQLSYSPKACRPRLPKPAPDRHLARHHAGPDWRATSADAAGRGTITCAAAPVGSPPPAAIRAGTSVTLPSTCPAPADRSRAAGWAPVSTPATSPAPARRPESTPLSVAWTTTASRTSSTPRVSIPYRTGSGQGHPRGTSSTLTARSNRSCQPSASSMPCSCRRETELITQLRQPAAASSSSASGAPGTGRRPSRWTAPLRDLSKAR